MAIPVTVVRQQRAADTKADARPTTHQQHNGRQAGKMQWQSREVVTFVSCELESRGQARE